MSIDRFYVLDFDRCLGRTEKFQALLEEVIGEEHVVSLKMIRYAHEEVKKTGGSFDTAAYVRQILKDKRLDVNRVWGRIESDFVEAARHQDMFEPYAKELLDLLKAKKEYFGILTYGGYDWQMAKLRAAGLVEVPHIITSYKEKGHMIVGWQTSDKRFLIPTELSAGRELLAKTVVLIDDKPVSFIGLPPEAKGFCVSPLVTQGTSVADLPPTVQVVPDMKRAVELLQQD